MDKMSKVLKIGICKNSADKIYEVPTIKVIKGKGVINDRHYSNNNDMRKHITLIESENIDYYNKKNNKKILYIKFRRNIITKGIKLNELIGVNLKIGNVVAKGVDLCRPCKHLQDLLGEKDIIKEFLRKGGLRCEVITNGVINVEDLIKI